MPKAPFKLLYNNDATNTFGCVSPWHEKGELFREEHLAASIDETGGAAGKGVDAHLLAPGLGWVPWWQSKIYPPAEHMAWWKARTGLKLSTVYGFDRYAAEGGDMVRVLIARCRAHGMAPFATFRMNDVHLQEEYGEKTQQSIFVCRFYAEHTEFLLDPDHKKRKGYYPVRGLNFVHPEVVNYKLGLICELCVDYDLAGIELDFLRDDHLFRQDQTTHDQRVAIITELVRQVRAALDAREVPGVPHRWLCVRIPAELRAHSAIGLDIEKLASAGVDMFNLSSWYHTPFRTDVAEARRRLPDSAIYVELTHSMGHHPFFLESGAYGTLGNPRCSDAELHTAANLALTRGADGISLFNFVYYRNHGPDADIPICEPPFHVLSQLRNPGWLSRQEQHYSLANAFYFNQLPRTLVPAEPIELQFDLALPAPAPRPKTAAGKEEDPLYPEDPPDMPIRLRLHFRTPVAGRDIAVAFNGQPARLSQNLTRFFGNPFDTMISPRANRLAFEFPRALLRPEMNGVEVRLNSGEPVELLYADLRVGLSTERK